MGDLKLTEHLSNELEALRNKFDSMHEGLETASLERDSFKKQCFILKNEASALKREMVTIKK